MIQRSASRPIAMLRFGRPSVNPFDHTLVSIMTLPGVHPPTVVPEADEVQQRQMRDLVRFNSHANFSQGSAGT